MDVLSITIVLLLAFAICLFFCRRHYEQRMESALSRAQKSEQLKSVFIDSVSHTLRNPLNAIKGYSEMILEDKNGNLQPAQLNEMATNINANANMLIGFLDKLYELSKFEGITPCFTFIEVNLTELMASYRREAMNITKPDVSVRVRTELSPHCKATLDTNLMHQLMLHLLTNATKYATEGDITIAYGRERKGLKVTITYAGYGRAEMIGADIYSFLQKEDALKHVNETSALGIAMCKAIVEVLGGEFYMDTEYEKKTVSSFWFPCQMRDCHKSI